MLGIEPGASYMQRMRSTTDLQYITFTLQRSRHAGTPQLHSFYLSIYLSHDSDNAYPITLQNQKMSVVPYWLLSLTNYSWPMARLPIDLIPTAFQKPKKWHSKEGYHYQSRTRGQSNSKSTGHTQKKEKCYWPSQNKKKLWISSCFYVFFIFFIFYFFG